MNKLRAVLASCCLIVLLLFVAFTIPSIAMSEDYSENQNGTVTSSAVDTKPVKYIMKEYNQKIGVYKVGDTEPFEILDVYVDTLPLQDRELLQSGINITSDEDLKSITEDYNS